MTESDAYAFVTRFTAAWAARDGDAFSEMWDAEGELRSPFYDRIVIIEEIVYVDTAPLQALRAGRPFVALVQLPQALV